MKMKPGIIRNLILVLITGIALSSCNKDDNNTDAIVGTWTSGTPTVAIMVGAKTLTQYAIDSLGFTSEEASAYVGFFETSLKESFVGTITVKSDHTYTSDLGDTPDSGTWSLNSDRTELTITSTTDGPLTFDVTELTSSKLKLHAQETSEEDLNDDTIPELVKIDLNMSLTR